MLDLRSRCRGSQNLARAPKVTELFANHIAQARLKPLLDHRHHMEMWRKTLHSDSWLKRALERIEEYENFNAIIDEYEALNAVADDRRYCLSSAAHGHMRLLKGIAARHEDRREELKKLLQSRYVTREEFLQFSAAFVMFMAWSLPLCEARRS